MAPSSPFPSLVFQGHVVLKTYMEEFRRNHTGLVRYEVGPPMMTEVVRRLCRSEIVDLVGQWVAGKMQPPHLPSVTLLEHSSIL